MLAANYLVGALKNPAPKSPFAQFGDQQLQSLKQLADFFQKQVNVPPPSPSVNTTRELMVSVKKIELRVLETQTELRVMEKQIKHPTTKQYDYLHDHHTYPT